MNRPEAILTAFAWLGYLRIDVTGDLFLVFFLLVFITFGTYVLINIVLLICGDECCGDLDNTWVEVLWWFLGDSILYGILFIPASTLALEMFNCANNDDGESCLVKNESMECWTPIHIVLCVLSVIILLCIIVGIRERAKEHDFQQHDASIKQRIRHDVNHIDARFAIVRFMGLILGINIAQISSLAASILMFFLFLYPLCYNIWYLPYVEMKYNYIYVAFYTFNVWSSLSVIVTVLTPNQWVGFVLWCLFPFTIAIACYICNKRLRSRPIDYR